MTCEPFHLEAAVFAPEALPSADWRATEAVKVLVGLTHRRRGAATDFVNKLTDIFGGVSLSRCLSPVVTGEL